jgi:hypothetical protein
LHAVPILTFVDVLAVFFVFRFGLRGGSSVFLGRSQGKDERVGGQGLQRLTSNLNHFLGGTLRFTHGTVNSVNSHVLDLSDLPRCLSRFA